MSSSNQQSGISKKQFSALFMISLIPWAIGNGLIPLLPIYVISMGADASIAGYFMSISYLALATGTVVAGWLSDKLDRRKLFLLITGVAAIPTLWLMGQATNIWQLAFLTILMWFFGGIGLSSVNILTGLHAGEDERGKIFGALSMTSGIGALIGGLSTGFLVDKWGYETMFTILAIFSIIWPSFSFLLDDSKSAPVQKSYALTTDGKGGVPRGFYLLFSASLIISIAGFIVVLGRSLSMSVLEFDAAAISSTEAVGGVVALPLPFLFGWLSDRTGRKRFLVLCYLFGLISLLGLTAATSLWHFWVVMALHTIYITVNGNVGSALVVDIVPKRLVGRGLALFNATTWIGGVIGYSIAGRSIQRLGLDLTSQLGSLLPLVAILLLLPIQEKSIREDSGKVRTKKIPHE